MDNDVATLIASAKTASIGLVKVAADKPNEHPLHSDAQTFRAAAHMLTALSMEVTRTDARGAELYAKLQRIAGLKVRNAAEAIEIGDWKTIVEELQAVAQEALSPGSSGKMPRAPRKVPRR